MASGVNQRVIDQLQLNDVPVIDLMGVSPGHNFGGDNLHAAIYGATHTGAVVDGTIRDVEGLMELPTQVYFRAPHPAAVAGVSILGINIPVHIGNALVMLMGIPLLTARVDLLKVLGWWLDSTGEVLHRLGRI